MYHIWDPQGTLCLNMFTRVWETQPISTPKHTGLLQTRHYIMFLHDNLVLYPKIQFWSQKCFNLSSTFLVNFQNISLARQIQFYFSCAGRKSWPLWEGFQAWDLMMYSQSSNFPWQKEYEWILQQVISGLFFSSKRQVPGTVQTAQQESSISGVRTTKKSWKSTSELHHQLIFPTLSDWTGSHKGHACE